MISPRLALTLATTVAVTAIGGTLAWIQMAGPRDCAAPVISGSSIGARFELVNGEGQMVTSEEVIDRPSLIYFGYTFCPDVCPVDLARNAIVVDILGQSGLEVRPVFITVDPSRDTPEVVADYSSNMHPKMIGLTGTEEEISKVAAAFGVYYQAQKSGDEYYLVDHSALTYLATPKDGVVTFFRREDGPESIAATVSCLID